MCGIVGWVAVGDVPVDAQILGRMRDRIVHRGPDGVGLWMSPSGKVGLGFRRLAIVDLSPTANQPMANEDGSVQVVFNGEIYNHAALRQELLARGHRFRTDHSDTEVIVHGYEEWGAKVVDRLDGKFGIGIWDDRTEQLLLVRDRVGVKPLYFSWFPGGFAFASEIKALLAHPSITPAIEPLATYHYLSFLATPAPLTMFKGIYKMPAGYRAVVTKRGTMTSERYWDAMPGMGPEAAELRTLSGPALRERAVSGTLALLDKAVEKRMMSDVPFGVFLSGGIDSTTNVALMARHVTQPLRTFTIGFSDFEHLNELDYAREVAQTFKTEHHEVMVDERAMREYLPSLVYSQDEPIADWVCIPLYFVSKLTRDSGTVVVQVGEGSDEQFCGYRSYMGYLDMYERYWRPYRRVPGVARRGAASVADWCTGFHDQHDAYFDIVVRAGRDREPFWSGATVFTESRKGRLIDRSRLAKLVPPPELVHSGLLPSTFGIPDSFEIVRSFFDEIDRRHPGSDQLTRMIYSEFKLRLPELLLMRVDKIGMSVSIEPRVPFLDHHLVEFTMNLPQSVKIEGGVAKSVLKQAVRGLIPDRIIDRPKMGFGAPMVEWMRGDFGRAIEAEIAATRFFDHFPANRGLVLDMLRRHRSGQADFALYLWTFYNAVAWFDSWVDGAREARIA